MANKMVKYHNDLNRVNFGGFTLKELDLFFTICFKVKEEGNKEVIINFKELKSLLNEENNPKRIKGYIDNMNKKLAQLNYQIEIETNVFERFVLFTNFTTNFNNQTLTIRVNDKFDYILNNLISNYTKFDLIEFINLKSIYSKILFRLLKQWDTVKMKEFGIDEFREILTVPKSYIFSKMDVKIIKPCTNELQKYFFNLEVQKIRNGRKVVGLKFTWEDKKEDKISEMEVIENKQIKISRKLFTMIEKARKNRYIQVILDNKGIAYLVERFTEEQLIKGLNCAYREVKQEIGSINYLVTLIENENKKQEIEIIIDDEVVEGIKKEKRIKNSFDEIFEEIPLDFKVDEKPKIEKIKITQKEADNLYQQYLKNNGVGNIKSVRIGFEKSVLSKYEIIEGEGKEEKIIPVKIVEFEEIPLEKILSKSGKKLVGGALKEKLKKIAKDESVKIKYKNEIIG